MMAATAICSPHAHDHSSVNRMMMHVCLALLPCTLFSFFLFSYPAVYLFLITVISAVLWESLCLMLLKKPQVILKDSSALLTGWLLALSLPPWAPWWIGVGGSFIAIVIGKQIYGGIGQNLFNPAMLARVALLISFPVHMTTWPLVDTSAISPLLSINPLQSLEITLGLSAIPDGTTGATALGHLKTQLNQGQTANAAITLFDKAGQSLLSVDNVLGNKILGSRAGSLGETSALLILLGGLWLLVMRIISWHIPVALLASVTLLATLFHELNPEHYAPASFHLLSGGVLLGAFFIATDLVTSPSSKSGQIVFGVGCGALVYIIRTWGGYPEGMGFAVLFMNALTPLIDLYFRPRVYGRKLNGSPLNHSPVSKTVEGSQQ